MKKLFNKPWFVVVLAVTALLFVGNAVYQGTRQPDYGSAASVGVEPAVPADGEAPAEGTTVRLPVQDALKTLVTPKSALRDPFAARVRDVNATATEEKFVVPDLVDTVHLSALWTQGGATYTLINDRICLAGDVIGRLKIESATQEGIWLTHWQGRNFVTLGGEFTLKTPFTKALAATRAPL